MEEPVYQDAGRHPAGGGHVQVACKLQARRHCAQLAVVVQFVLEIEGVAICVGQIGAIAFENERVPTEGLQIACAL